MSPHITNSLFYRPRFTCSAVQGRQNYSVGMIQYLVEMIQYV